MFANQRLVENRIFFLTLSFGEPTHKVSLTRVDRRKYELVIYMRGFMIYNLFVGNRDKNYISNQGARAFVLFVFARVGRHSIMKQTEEGMRGWEQKKEKIAFNRETLSSNRCTASA